MSSRALPRLGARLSTKSSRSVGNTIFGVTPVGGSTQWTKRDLSTLCNKFRLGSNLFKPVRCEDVLRCRQSSVASEPEANKAPEKPSGNAIELEFQAETRQLLDIVARSLYSEKEVFVRELISNASDAIEKFRYLQVTLGSDSLTDPSRQRQIDVSTDKVDCIITIADNGIGMTKEDMISNLGTIARSGSKSFMEELQSKKDGILNPEAIIGQFGVGFYSAFMVANKIEVFSLHSSPGSKAFHWSSDGSGKYTIREAENVKPGTKVVVHLKPERSEFADENKVKEIIKKYSSFVGTDVYLNGVQSNDLKPVWLMDPKEVDAETHEDFYRYVANAFDKPRFVLHFRIDTPMDVRALIYVPESRPGLFETSREAEAGVSLYCRKVLIKSKTENIIPKWMRFVKGVVDSEDIPLNLSRELLQDSAQIRKIRTVITNKFLRFLGDKAKKGKKSFLEFYKDYGFFFKEGIITSNEQYEKEEIAKLLMFESSSEKPGELISLTDYCQKMKPGQREIYYLAAPSRQLAENSPYFEALKKKDVDILFCYEAYDELVLMQLQQFDKKNLRSVEKEMREGADEVKDDAKDDEASEKLDSEAQAALSDWIRAQLMGRANSVKVTKKLESHPCVVTVQEMAAARHFVKTQGSNFTEEQRYEILQPQFEINPGHPIIKKINELRTSNKQLAILVTEQLFMNAMVAAGLVDDPRTILKSMNSLLQAALEKH